MNLKFVKQKQQTTKSNNTADTSNDGYNIFQMNEQIHILQKEVGFLVFDSSIPNGIFLYR